MLEELWSWVSSIPVAIWGSFIAGGMTLVGVLIGQYTIHRRQERQAEKELEALTSSLIVELRTSDDWIERLLYIAHNMEKAKESAYNLTEEHRDAFDSDRQMRFGTYLFTSDQHQPSTNVFHSNTHKIGRLDSEASKSAVLAYNHISSLESSLQDLNDTITLEQLMDSKMKNTTRSTEVIFQEIKIKQSVTLAAFFQKLTLMRLGDSITESDREIFIFAYSHMDPQSKDHEEIQQSIKNYMEKNDLN